MSARSLRPYPFSGILFFVCTMLGYVSSAYAQISTRLSANIDWEAAEKSIDDTARNDREAISRFRASAVDKDQTDKISLPVLIPKSGMVRANPDLQHQRSSYAATFPLERNARVTILGSSSSLQLPDDSSLGKGIKASGDQYVFERTEDGADMNFTRFGASYVIRISCQDHADKRCNSEEYLRTVVDSLVTVGGKKP